MRMLILWLLLCLSAVSHAHKASDSYLTLTAQDNGQLQVRWDIALRDLDMLLNLDVDNNRQLTWGEIVGETAALQQLVRNSLIVQRWQQPCSVFSFSPLALDNHVDGTYAVFVMHSQCQPQGAWALQYRLLQELDASHRGITLWQQQSQMAQTLVLSASNEWLALGKTSTQSTVGDFWLEGVHHIWSGYDHILFLLSLLLPVVLVWSQHSWRPIDKWQSALWDAAGVVTAFTLAHSITLILAALNWVYLPSRWVEAAIAASVVIAAIHNVWPMLNRWRWLMAFGFGLIHGFGFASALADLTAGVDARLWALVGFNLGVESGQLAIVFLFVPLAYAVRCSQYYQRWLVTGGSITIASIAGLWLCQRLLDVVWIPG